MLTQKIERYKSPPLRTYHHPPYIQQQHPNLPVVLRHPQAMGKLEFAMYLRDLHIKKGDWVTYKTAHLQLNNYNVYKVLDIDEIHHFIKDWGSNGNGPSILHMGGYRDHRVNGIITPERANPWKAPPGLYVKVDPSRVPEELKKLYADTDDNTILCSC